MRERDGAATGRAEVELSVIKAMKEPSVTGLANSLRATETSLSNCFASVICARLSHFARDGAIVSTVRAFQPSSRTLLGRPG